MMYVANSNAWVVCTANLSYDGVGIRGLRTIMMILGNLSQIYVYQKITFYILYNQGITRICLSTRIMQDLSVPSAYHATPYHNGIAFTNPTSHSICFISNRRAEIHTIVGNGSEGNQDGPANISALNAILNSTQLLPPS